MEWSDFKRNKDLAELQAQAEASDNRLALELLDYVRKLHEEIRQSNYHSMVEDDDPEEWDRWIYRSGRPGWAGPPEWFIKEHASWVTPFPDNWEDDL
jgi:hypothetical protein